MTNYINTASRNAGILSPYIKYKSIFVGGVSASGFLIEKMARQGLGAITVCDPGNVKYATLSRMAFTSEDARYGRAKVTAMHDRLEAICTPQDGLYVTSIQDEVQSLPVSAYEQYDLIIAATDSVEAQKYLSDVAAKNNIPFLAIGIHSRGLGGHVLWRVPEEGQACYQCGLSERFDTDHESVDLESEPANLVDIQSVDMVAMRIALAILDRNEPTLMGQFYEMIRDKGYAVVGNHPDYEYGNSLVDALFGDLPDTLNQQIQDIKRHAFLGGYTVWLISAADKDCPICGSAEQS